MITALDFIIFLCIVYIGYIFLELMVVSFYEALKYIAENLSNILEPIVRAIYNRVHKH